MKTSVGTSLKDYLALSYPFRVVADPDGGYVIVFPDLPGCITQADSIEDIGPMAEDARRLWITTAWEDGHDIPLPSYPEEYSGRFNLRLPRSLHRELVDAAESEGVSLNQYVVTLLSQGNAQARIERRLYSLESKLDEIHASLRYQVASVPAAPKQREHLQLVWAESEALAV